MDIRNTAVSTDARSSSFSLGSQVPDAPSAETETRYINLNWGKQWTAFQKNPDLKTAILLKAVWIVGKGYETEDSKTKIILEHIRGIGKDNFLSLIFNMEVIKRVGGDAFAEIMREKDTIVNIKVIDPSAVAIVTNKKGMITKYEITLASGKIETIMPDDMLHLSHNRLSWQCHGISDVDADEETILADEESFQLTRELMRKAVRPLLIWKLKTDKQSDIAAFVTKVNEARKWGEDLFIPDDENIATLEPPIQVTPSPVVFQWRDEIRNRFYRTIGLPQIVPGAAGQSSESEGKTIYFAFEQLCAKDRIFLENDLWQQLYLKVHFVPPQTMQAAMSADEAKDGNGQILNQASDLDVASGR